MRVFIMGGRCGLTKMMARVRVARGWVFKASERAGWDGFNKTVCNAKAASKNPREGVGGLNKGALQNAAIF